MRISFDIPDNQSQRFLDGLAKFYSYQVNIWSPTGLIPNPETKGQFVKRKILEEQIERVKAQERQPAPEPTPITIT